MMDKNSRVYGWPAGGYPAPQVLCLVAQELRRLSHAPCRHMQQASHHCDVCPTVTCSERLLPCRVLSTAVWALRVCTGGR